MYKHYGGIEWFENKPFFLLSKCLIRGIDKEMEIPNLLEQVVSLIFKKEELKPVNKKMRTASEIMNDYGLGGVL